MASLSGPERSLLARFERLVVARREMLAAQLEALWSRLDGHNEEDVPGFVERAAPLVAGAKASTVALSAAFYAAMLGRRPVAVRAGDVPAEARLEAPFHARWRALSEGGDLAGAFEVGRGAARTTAAQFVRSTSFRTGDLVASGLGLRVRWERVPNVGACRWCVMVAGRLYNSAEAADFGHGRCGCLVVPLASF